jgi:hypothetical protein
VVVYDLFRRQVVMVIDNGQAVCIVMV